MTLCRKCMTFPAGCPQHGRALRRQQADRDRKQAIERHTVAEQVKAAHLAVQADEMGLSVADVYELRAINRTWMEQQQRKAWPEMFKPVINKYAKEVYL
jgi:hypothetical protein